MPLRETRIRTNMRMFEDPDTVRGLPELHGRVCRGDGVGRLLGYPTANLASSCRRPRFRGRRAKAEQCLDEHFVPDGIYAGWAHFSGRRLPAVAIIGVDGKREVHIINWRGSLYGRYLRMTVARRIRNVRRFRTDSLLKRQISKDIAAAIKILKKF